MRILPRDETFFDLLVSQAKNVLEASRLLESGLTGSAGKTEFNATAQQLRDLERKGDAQLRAILYRLHKTFITPIDPEDVHQLASRIDEILDHLDAAAYRIDAYGLDRPPAGLQDIARQVHGCVQATVEALEVLERDGVKKPDLLTTRCEEINRRESETEDSVRAAVRDLFANERDPITLIKHKEICEFLESAADCCEDVAATLETIAVKNS